MQVFDTQNTISYPLTTARESVPAMFQYWCIVILITVTRHTATAQECTDTPTFAFTSPEHMYRGHVVVTDQVGSIIYYVSYVYTNHTFVLLRALIYRLILSG